MSLRILTEKQLQAIERSRPNDLVRRLVACVRELVNRADEWWLPPPQKVDVVHGSRMPILLVQYACGAVEVYGPREEVSLKVVGCPNLRTNTPEAQDELERWIEFHAGANHRDLLMPGCLITRTVPDRRTFKDRLNDELDARTYWELRMP